MSGGKRLIQNIRGSREMKQNDTSVKALKWMGHTTIFQLTNGHICCFLSVSLCIYLSIVSIIGYSDTLGQLLVLSLREHKVGRPLLSSSYLTAIIRLA